MSPEQRTALQGHIAQERLARAAQRVAAVLGAVGGLYYGLPAVLLGVGGYLLFGMARPGPIKEHDELTGRGR
jgi:hypothetical protein